MFPWHYGDHFSVFVIDIVKQGCYIMDSLEVNPEKEQLLLRHARKLTGLFICYVTMMLYSDGTGSILDINEFAVIHDVPKQPDNYSCGLYAIMFCKGYNSSWQDGRIDRTLEQIWATKVFLDKMRKDMFEAMVVHPDNILLPSLLDKVQLAVRGQKGRGKGKKKT